MIKKAVLGGTFDPIHNGHMHIAYEALYQLKLDKVVFMPAGKPPHKSNRIVTAGNIRYEMVKKAIEDEKRFEIDDYEIVKSGFSYTYETLEYLNTKESDTDWYFISGVDCLIDLSSWKKVDKILQLCTLVVFNRPGYTNSEIKKQKEKMEKIYGEQIVFLDLPLMDISSSNIREKLRNGQNISYLVPGKVNKYIEKAKLYAFK